MLQTALVIVIAFVVFMLFWMIVSRAKKQERQSPMHSCGSCSQHCSCSTDSGTLKDSVPGGGKADTDDTKV